MKRRQFIGSSAAASAAAVSSLASSRARGANDHVRIGLIGCGGRGRFVAQQMQRAPGVKFVGVCDVYEANRERARRWAGTDCQAFKDFRHLLDQHDVDALRGFYRKCAESRTAASGRGDWTPFVDRCAPGQYCLPQRTQDPMGCPT